MFFFFCFLFAKNENSRWNCSVNGRRNGQKNTNWNWRKRCVNWTLHLVKNWIQKYWMVIRMAMAWIRARRRQSNSRPLPSSKTKQLSPNCRTRTHTSHTPKYIYVNTSIPFTRHRRHWHERLDHLSLLVRTPLFLSVNWSSSQQTSSAQNELWILNLRCWINSII